MNFAGYDVIVAQAYPRMTLSENVPVTPEFRVEMNEWLRGFFGVEYLVPAGQAIVLEQERKIVMRPDDYAMLQIRQDAADAFRIAKFM